jgi:hypothetical protein
LTFGSSLNANSRAVGEEETRLVGRRPCRSRGVEASVMSNWIRISPPAGTLRLRTSMTPVPAAPPVLLVAVMSAPGGVVTSDEGARARSRLAR